LIQFFCRMELRRSFTLNEVDFVKLRESVDSDSYSDGADTELVVISNICAYFDVSSKRLIEVVPMICDTSLSLKLVNELKNSFMKQLGIGGASGLENCQRFLQEDPDVRERKQILRRQQEIVNRAEQILSSVKC
jgi:Dynamin GTPase effector domain